MQPSYPFKEFSQRYRNTWFRGNVANEQYLLYYVHEVVTPNTATSEDFNVVLSAYNEEKKTPAKAFSVKSIKITHPFPNFGMFKFRRSIYSVARSAQKQYSRAANLESLTVNLRFRNDLESFSSTGNAGFANDFLYVPTDSGNPGPVFRQAFYPTHTKLKLAVNDILYGVSFGETLSSDFAVVPSFDTADQIDIHSLMTKVGHISVAEPNKIIFGESNLDQELIDLLHRTGQKNDFSYIKT